jgi:hypothetical protein
MNKLIYPFEEEIFSLVGFDIDSITGSDQGTNEFADVITQSADGSDLNAMWREFQASVALLNRQRDPLVNLLTFPVTRPTERIMLPTTEDFQRASEYGEPTGIRLGQPFVAGYDFTWYDIAIRYTWLFLAESDAAQISALNATALEADNRLVFQKVLGTIFNNANSSAVVNDQNVTVYRFYNNDGTTPPDYKSTTFNNTHNHYVASGSTSVDSGDMDALELLLGEHGYRLTLGYRLALLVNRQEGDIIRTFQRANGDKYDFIPGAAVGGGVFLPANSGVVGAPGGSIPGQIGTYGPFLVVEDDYIPAGYMVAFATGGERNVGNPVGIREHEVASLRGLRLMPGPGRDYPLTDSFYNHGLGTGVRHRGAGAVMQITAGSYSVPAAYASMP